MLLLDKPLGLSSNDALQKAKWLLRAEKAATPARWTRMATGLLPLCFGAATKFSQLSLDADKRYLATLALGIRTSTGDAEGECWSAAMPTASPADRRRLRRLHRVRSSRSRHALGAQARGQGAVRIRARRRRDRAPAAPRDHSRSIAIVEMHAATVTLDVRCSKGTYIRTLAEDIGTRLGCGARWRALRRTGGGVLTCKALVTLAQLAALPDATARARSCCPPIACWPATARSASARRKQRACRPCQRRRGAPDAGGARLWTRAARLSGQRHITAGELIADRLLTPPEVAAAAGPRISNPEEKSSAPMSTRSATSPSSPTLTTARPPLVDQLLRQSGTFADHEKVVDTVMDSNAIERERGITILAKNCAVSWGGTHINIVDTPGTGLRR